MYKTNPDFLNPSDGNVKIWRYMDITKYLSLLERRSLFFSRADCLGDPFEGSLPSTKGQINLTEIVKKEVESRGFPTDKITPIHDLIRKCSFVCSFHMNDCESAALWSIYTKTQQGIAIQSTFNKLCNSFKEYSENPIHIGTMHYIDYDKEIITKIQENSFIPLLFKRKSFEHEKELRAAISFPRELYPESSAANPIKVNNFIRGLNIPVNLDILIERIFVAPTTEEWISDLLISTTKNYGIKKPIIQSNLDKSPIF